MAAWLRTADRNFEDGFKALLGQKREQAEDVNEKVASIIAQVRADGDRALPISRSASTISICARPGIRVSEAEIEAAGRKVNKATREALKLAHDRILDHHKRQLPKDDRYRDPSWGRTRHALDAGSFRRALCPGRDGELSKLSVDECAAGKGRRRSPRRHDRAGAEGRAQPAGACCAAELAGVSEIYRVGGAPGHRRARLRHRDHRARGKDRRPRQCLRRGGEAPGLRPSRHRHGGGPFGGRGHRRPRQRSGLDRLGPSRPGRARRSGASHPRHRRCRFRPRRRLSGGGRACGAAPCRDRAGELARFRRRSSS